MMRTLVTCEPAAETIAPCATGYAPGTAIAYVSEAEPTPFDTTEGLAFWSAAFVFTVALYVGVRGIGAIVKMVR